MKLKYVLTLIALLGLNYSSPLITNAYSDGSESSGGGDSSFLVYDGKRINASKGQLNIVPQTDFFTEKTCFLRNSECRVQQSSYYTTGRSVRATVMVVLRKHKIGVHYNGAISRFSIEETINTGTKDKIYNHKNSDNSTYRSRDEAARMAIKECQEEIISSFIEAYGNCN